MNKETIEALRQIEKEKGIPFDLLMEALEDALHSAYHKTPRAVSFSEVKIDRDTGEIRVFELIFPPGQEPQIEDEETEIDTSMATREEITPEDFGRIAAQTAKQVIYQRIREAEQGIVYQEYSDRIGEIVTGIVQQSDSRYTLVDLGRVEARLPKNEQVPTERYEHGMRLKAVIKEVSQNPKEPPIILSRRSEELVRRLFELEVPEIYDGLVEIVGVAREPGYRSKISVISHSDGVDPVGACVGPRGSRVRMVVSELRGEKIDIIPFDEEPARFVAKSLSPARVREVLLDDAQREATVVVPDDQLSLAIGKDGQNARLANRLTGWKIDIKSETEMTEEEAVYVAAEDEPQVVDGRCHYLTTGGKRCPNAALPGSLYCGIPLHQSTDDERT
ncbi:MAG: transcription termination/antitermination protein NusA [Actinobacteria bacterium]|jgi:N utilization substance protein A|nr:transcription termination/antitermination protein NusA [Actinomycetota bacterium]